MREGRFPRAAFFHPYFVLPRRRRGGGQNVTAQDGLPDDIRQYVTASVPSVPFLEALLLLHAEQSAPWDAHRLAHRLYMSEPAAARLLDQLLHAGLLARAGQAAFAFGPAVPQVRDLVARLSQVYGRRLVEISNLVHAANARRGL